VLQSALAHSDLFDHDPSELSIWLDSLPRTIRSPNAKGLDDDELVDERETMIAILDKCIRECIKAPWTFVEACLSVYTGSTGQLAEDQMDSTEEPLEGYSPATAAGPLLMTLLEMFEGLWNGEPNLPSSATLAVATYLRRVIFGLSLKQPNAQYARRIVSRLHRVLSSPSSPHHSISIVNGVKREIDILENALSASEHATKASNADEKQEVIEFLEQVESLEIGLSSLQTVLKKTHVIVDSENASTTAYDLVDWIRLSGRSISASELLRMIELVQAWYPPALRELILQVDPSQTACVPTLYNTGHLH
jgi:nucleolar pre-ribosomal-associated protein 1